MSPAHDAAVKVAYRLDSTKIPLAVFKYHSGSWFMTSIKSAKFARFIERMPHTLIGVYDHDFNFDQLVRDFDEMGLR